MSSPFVSVVIPLYNKERDVAIAVKSVLGQTHAEFEVVVVDDGSTDASRCVVESIRDPRLRIISRHNGGVCAARNTGITEARADLIAFLDADDEWAPDFLGTIVRLSQRHPGAGAYATRFWMLDADGAQKLSPVHGIPTGPWEGVVPDYYATKGLISSSCVAIRRQVFDRVGAFREGVRIGEDLDMWFRIGAYYQIGYSTVALAVWRRGAANRACEQYPPHDSLPMQRSFDELFRDSTLPHDRKEAARRYVAGMQLDHALLLCCWGRRKQAIEVLNSCGMETGINPDWAWHRLIAAVPFVLLSTSLRLRRRAFKALRRLASFSPPHRSTS